MKRKGTKEMNNGRIYNNAVYGFKRVNGELIALVCNGGEAYEFKLTGKSVTACVKEMRKAGIVVMAAEIKSLKTYF